VSSRDVSTAISGNVQCLVRIHLLHYSCHHHPANCGNERGECHDECCEKLELCTVYHAPPRLRQAIHCLDLLRIEFVLEEAVRSEVSAWNSVVHDVDPTTHVAGAERCFSFVVVVERVLDHPSIARLEDHRHTLAGQPTQYPTDSEFCHLYLSLYQQLLYLFVNIFSIC